MRWLVVGSGPRVREQLAAARRNAEFDYTITANAGIRLLHPTHYVLSDRLARKIYCREYRRDQHLGTKLVWSFNSTKPTHRLRTAKQRQTFTAAHLDWQAERFKRRLRMDDAFWYVSWRANWRRGQYIHGKKVGAFLIQYAMNNGATEVHVIGCKGFAKTLQSRGSLRSFGAYERTMAHVAVTCAPETTTFFYGPITYGRLLNGHPGVRVLQPVAGDRLLSWLPATKPGGAVPV